MLRNLKFKKMLAFSIPVLILVAMTISPLLTNFYGVDIKLKTMPVDPRDLLRGDYVILSYEIQDVDTETLDNDIVDYFKADNHKYKVSAYAALEEDSDGFYTVKNISFKKPEGIYLKGMIKIYSTFEPLNKENAVYEDENGEYIEPEGKYIDVYSMDYNIDKYFVPENTGKMLEDASIKGDLTAIVRIHKGNALLKDVYIK